jgi:cytochrome c biogenesis protein CcmG/thiol:disulfide interchange protein DsbE
MHNFLTPRRATWRAALVSCAMLAVLNGNFACATEAPAANVFDLTAYRGKVVVLDFWASWCTPCRHSIPWLNELQARYGQRGLVVVGVNTDPERADADRFMRSVPIKFPVVFDPEGRLAAHYKIPGMPTSMVFDREGHLLRSHIGFRDAERAAREQEIFALLESGK